VTLRPIPFPALLHGVRFATTATQPNPREGKRTHEFVAIRIADDETRPVSELVGLPEEEIEQVFGQTEPATVILASPGATDEPGAVVGDGTISEPGRYAVVCFIPVGMDPELILDPTLEGPPEGAGPPHDAQGMYAELQVD
jgi:hypothetical protein